MESAIDKHLMCPRTLSRRVPDDYQPPFPMWVGRADEQLTQVVMAYLGVQYQGDGQREQALQAMQETQPAAQETAPVRETPTERPSLALDAQDDGQTVRTNQPEPHRPQTAIPPRPQGAAVLAAPAVREPPSGSGKRG